MHSHPAIAVRPAHKDPSSPPQSPVCAVVSPLAPTVKWGDASALSIPARRRSIRLPPRFPAGHADTRKKQ